MYPEPGSERNRPRELVAVLAKFSHGGVAPDHRHDAFVHVVERLSWLSHECGRNIVRTVLARLLRHGCKLGLRFAVRTGDVRKIS